MAATKAVQAGFTLTRPDGSSPAKHAGAGVTVPAPDAIAALSAQQYFTTALDIMSRGNPATPEDPATAARLANLGLVSDGSFKWNRLSSIQKNELKKAVAAGPQLNTLGQLGYLRDTVKDKWVYNKDNMGNFGTDYDTRYATAIVGLGANPKDDADYIVQSALFITEGTHDYTITFTKEHGTPPVHPSAFWSLTIYDAAGYTIPNDFGRYAIGTTTRPAIKTDADGNTVIYLSYKQPADTTNWLPIPQGQFSVTARLYWPDASVLNGNWEMPALTCVNCPAGLFSSPISWG